MTKTKDNYFILERAGINTLSEGQKISFETATNKGKISAANLKLL